MIADGQLVVFRYCLTDVDGRVLEQSGREPVEYVHGSHVLVPGLERAMAGRRPGERFETTLAPSDAYGDHQDDARVVAQRADLPDDIALELGMIVLLEDAHGDPLPVWITEVREGEVVLDRNHPLAGVTLRYSVEIVDVRDPSGARGHG